MNIRRLLRSYKQKLLLEGILKSLAYAASACGVAVFITSLIYHILVLKMPLWVFGLVGMGVFLPVFSLVFGICYYPTSKRVARRMDEMGLKERVGTMLEYRKESGFMVELQREDAISHIQQSSPRQMKMRPFLKEGIACGVCLALALTMLALPHDLFEVSAEKEEETPTESQSDIIKDLIEELREEVKNALIDEELKEEVNEVIDRLEEDLNKTDSELEQAGKIEDAKEEIKDLLEKELTRKSIGLELQKYHLTKPLGVAVCDGDLDKTAGALDALRGRLEAFTYLVEGLYKTIDKALVDSGVEESDELYSAFADFSQALKELDPQSASFSEDLAAVFESAKAAILKALEKQAVIEEEKDKMEEILNDAKEEILEGEKPEGEKQEGKGEEGKGEEGKGEEGKGEEGKGEEGKGEEGKGGEGKGEGEEKGDGNGGGDDEENKGGSGLGGEGEVLGMTEGIYDPVSGEVSFGKVFATYYAEYLAARKEGKIPEEMKTILDAYFATLTNTKE